MKLAQVQSPDNDLELDIKAALDACHAAKAARDQGGASRHWERFVGLIASRSPKQVARMERERGLN